MLVDDSLDAFATPRQLEYLKAVREASCPTHAAKALGVHHSVLLRSMYRLKEQAAIRGYAPESGMTKPAPSPFVVRGVSTLYGQDGDIKQQWVKTRLDDEKVAEAIQAVADGLADDLPRYAPIPRPVSANSDLMSAYVITDFHLGMLADADECGVDWDTKLAEKLLVSWFKTAIDLAPDSQVAVFAQLGDLMHTDGWDALTPASKNLLDVDTRFQKTIRAAIRVIRQIVAMLLAKHPEVRIIMADANHDPASGAWLREWLAAVYDNEPRITVDTSMDSYYCVEWDQVSLFFHHGHKRKVGNVDDVFVAKFREVFGRTKYSYAHLGHLHSNELKETNLMQVERHRTLAPGDAYSSKGGWISGREAKIITYHRKYGEVARVTVTPDMV